VALYTFTHTGDVSRSDRSIGDEGNDFSSSSSTFFLFYFLHAQEISAIKWGGSISFLVLAYQNLKKGKKSLVVLNGSDDGVWVHCYYSYIYLFRALLIPSEEKSASTFYSCDVPKK
jgi:hypothetical protein